MRQIDVDMLSAELCQVALDAGAAVIQIYQNFTPSAAQLAAKADASPLTMADLASHHLIVERLTALTPDIPVVSEEDGHSLAHRTQSGSFWLLDPLDGTKEFLARNGEFTVNIALITEGEPVWGVVAAPALNQMFWGGRSYGSYRLNANGLTPPMAAPIRVAAPVVSGNAYRVMASKSHLNPETSAFIIQLGSTELVQAGSSLKFCRIAEGCADVYPRLAPTCEWDTAAAQAVLEGAGGHVYDISGNRLLYGKTDVLNPSFIAASVSFDALMSGSIHNM
jgi:3'(2'), 5'-bisphosphate nucleotidase